MKHNDSMGLAETSSMPISKPSYYENTNFVFNGQSDNQSVSVKVMAWLSHAMTNQCDSPMLPNDFISSPWVK